MWFHHFNIEREERKEFIRRKREKEICSESLQGKTQRERERKRKRINIR